MSDIRVGDKVRVVQIIVREVTRSPDVQRVRYLGKEGTVTSYAERFHFAYVVLLSGDTMSSFFRHEELKVLSVPCEQREPDGTMESLHAQVTHLLAANECIRHTLAGQYSLSERRRVLLAELQEKYDMLRAGEVVQNARDAFAGQIKVNEQLRGFLRKLREKYNNLARPDHLAKTLRELREGNKELSESLASLQETYTTLLQDERVRKLRNKLVEKGLCITRLQDDLRELQEKYGNALQASAFARTQIREILRKATLNP